MELEEAISKLKYELDKSKIVKKYQGKSEELFDDLDEYIKSIETALNHLTKQEKMIELIEKECRQRLAFAKRIRRSEKRNPDDFNQGLEFESATIMNLLSGEPHWKYEGKYFDDIDKQVEKLKAEESE